MKKKNLAALSILCAALMTVSCGTTPVESDTTEAGETQAAPAETETAAAETTAAPAPDTEAPAAETTAAEETTAAPVTPTEVEYDKGWLDYAALGASKAGSAGTEAATGTALTSWALEQTGTYYLTGNITASEAIKSFNGVIDGCGYTITASAPLFEDFGGELKNVTVECTYKFELAGGLIAASVTSDAKFENVLVRGTVTAAAETVGINIGGFIGTVKTEGSVSFKNCEFTGSIVNELVAGGNNRKTGGFIGILDSGNVTFTQCTNSADITASSHVGGFIGEITSKVTLTLQGCTNTGKVSDTKEGNAGGLIGYGANTAGCPHIIHIYNCRNTGSISNVSAGAGGIYGRSASGNIETDIVVAYCSNAADNTASGIPAGIVAQLAMLADIHDCINEGNMTTTGNNYAGGILGYNSGSINITNCVNKGTISGPASSKYIGGIVGCITKDGGYLTSCVNYGNVSLGNEASTDGRAGGIAGSLKGVSEIKNCFNLGTVTLTCSAEGKPCAGIVAFVEDMTEITNCGNLGDVTSNTTFAGGILGYTSGTAVEISGCYNAAKITAKSCAASVAFFYNVAAAVPSNNFYMADTGNNAYVIGPAEETKTNDGATEFLSAEVTSGKLLEKLKAVSKDVTWSMNDSPAFPIAK